MNLFYSILKEMQDGKHRKFQKIGKFLKFYLFLVSMKFATVKNYR